jgi:hypothetical protein
MLDVRFWKNPRFSAASAAITITFLAMFGSIFLLTQYLQFVLGYSPLSTGVRLLTFAVPMMVVSPLSPKVVERIGTKYTVALGLLCVAVGLVTLGGVSQTTPFLDIGWRMALAATGMALTMSPATESIMGSLPLARAGVGSAVNDTTRQVGGAVGVAVIGSVFSSIYGSKVVAALQGHHIPSELVANAKQQLGYAIEAAGRLPASAAHTFVVLAKSSFMDGFHAGLYVGAAVTVIGVVTTLVFLPSRARAEDVERQDAEFAERPDAAAVAVPAGTPAPAAVDGNGAPHPAPAPVK